MIGRTLSHYRIEEAIGRGGMGAVYRARDTKLDRDVAIKVLPEELMADETRRRRFVQEAKAAAAVHHPHVATIHEIDEVDGVHFLVMELISGEKLADVLARQRLSVSRTLELAGELVEGLSKAHDKRVVHRDLKPQNVMVTEDGHIKIIDFGLARLRQDLGEASAAGSAEPLTLTREGQILGTVSYMSPEQARGEAVDHRSDIFSFGIVLYEMLTGSVPFRGKTGTDTLSAILRDPTPRLSGIEHGEELQHVVNRCLAKDPEERYQATKDLLADVRRIKRDAESGTQVAAVPPRRARVLWVVAPTLLVVGAIVFWPRGGESPLPRVRRAIQVSGEVGPELDAAISPDGKLVAYAAGPLGATKIFVIQVAGGRPVPLTTDLPGAHRFPHWSSDGAQISFQLEDSENWETHIVPALGGAPRLFPVPGALELIWSPDGQRIAYFAETEAETGLFVGHLDGSDAHNVMMAAAPCCLSWSPDGKRIAFSAGNSVYLYNLNVGPSSLWVVDLDGGASVRVTDDSYQNLSPVWTADGKGLQFVSDRGGGRDVYRLSIDSTGRPVGDPARLTTGLNVFTISSSANGRLLSYSVATSRQNIWSLPVPRTGSISVQGAHPVTSGNRRSEAVGVSPDGRWLAFDLNQNGNVSIFKMPVGSSAPVQVTEGPKDFFPTWSPDSTEIAFHAIRTDNRDIFLVSADGGTVRQLTNSPAHEFYPHWSPDGNRIVFHSTRGGANDEVWLNEEIYVVSKDKGEPYGEVPEQLTFDQGGYAPRWSPDGRLIAYWSEKWGGIWVVPSGGGAPRRLTDFGHRPMWSKDSRTLYFRGDPFEAPQAIWSVSVSGDTPERVVLFDDPVRQPVFPDWSSDGETFYFTLTELEADVWVMELEDSEGSPR